MTMTEPTSPDRLSRFRHDMAELKVPDPTPTRDRKLVGLGVALMVAGIVLGAVAYNLSHSTTDANQQYDAIVVALIGVATSVVGGFVFLRYSLAGFFRFWLARALFDQREREERLLTMLDERRNP